jgi:PmbA protein
MQRRHGVSVSVLAGSGIGMERDYDFSSAVHGSDLEDPVAMGRRARRARGQTSRSPQGRNHAGAGDL